MPGFQENGQFIGEQRYRQMLQMQNPPLTPDEFEEQVRRGVTLEKLQAALTDWITRQRHGSRRRVQAAQREGQARRRVVPGRQVPRGARGHRRRAVRATTRRTRTSCKIPEKRKVRYALVDMQAIRDRTQVSPQDIQRYYEDNQQQYSTPEQVRASHILLKTEGKDDAAVKKQAEDLLAKVKAGADFAELATKYLGGRRAARSRAATSTSSPRARWCRSSTRWRSR